MRRRGLWGIAVVFVVVTAGCDWPMFRDGPDRTGFTTDSSISKDAVSSSMVLSWRGTAAGNVDSSPAVVNGVVYVGSFNHRLSAFDATGATGCSGSPGICAPLWTATTGGPVGSSPAVAGGVVYVGSDDTKLYAFDAAGRTNCSGNPKTCQPLWTASTFGAVTSSPAVANGVVYVGSADKKLYAFDAAGTTNCSGSPKRCAPLWTGDAHGEVSSPAVVNGVVYVGSTDGYLYAFDAAGKGLCTSPPKSCFPRWNRFTHGAVGTPAVADGVVYVASNDPYQSGNANLYTFDAADGNPLWRAALGDQWLGANPAVANGLVYVPSGQLDARLYVFDARGTTNCSGVPKTCTAVWTAPMGSSGSSPTVANGVVYVGDSVFDDVVAFDADGVRYCSGSPKTCGALWVGQGPNGFVVSSPAVVNGVVYVGSDDGFLYAFGLDRTPPTTAIVQPSNGATLSGTATLAASASDDARVTRVEYRLTGGNFNDTLIGTATPHQCCGWVYNWNTKGVPNGTYTLNSVATDPAGNVGRSANVTTTVKN